MARSVASDMAPAASISWSGRDGGFMRTNGIRGRSLCAARSADRPVIASPSILAYVTAAGGRLDDPVVQVRRRAGRGCHRGERGPEEALRGVKVAAGRQPGIA